MGNEFPVESFSCTKKLNHGYLYVGVENVCFATTLFPKNNALVMPMHKIKRMQPQQSGLVFDTGLRFVMEDGIEHSFRGFLHRDKAMAEVVAQAEKVGINIDVERH